MKIMLVSDGVALTTGFATVARKLTEAFIAEGWEIAHVPCLDTAPMADPAPYAALGVRPYFPGEYDPIGRTGIEQVIADAKPDCVVNVCDPGIGANWHHTYATIPDMPPTVLYAPVEGSPLMSIYAEGFKLATRALTVTGWGAGRLKAEHGLDVPWVYHGVDTAAYRPLDEGSRRRIRREIGWEGKFVVICVARNNGRKNLPALIKAMQFLREGLPGVPGREDYQLYLHCKAFDGGALDGTDLAFVANCAAVGDRVEYAALTRAVAGESVESLAHKVAAADLFVSTSEVEGFNIPLIEAMAAGTPVVIPADGGNQEEVMAGAALATVQPVDWLTWKTGADLAIVSPRAVAMAIHTARENPTLRRAAAEAGLDRIRSGVFAWEPMQRAVVAAVQEAVRSRDAAEPAEPEALEAVAG